MSSTVTEYRKALCRVQDKHSLVCCNTLTKRVNLTAPENSALRVICPYEADVCVMGVLRDIIWVITSRWNRWRGGLRSTHARDTYTQFWLGSLKGKYVSEALCVNLRIILKQITKYGVRVQNSIHGSGQGQMTGSCKRGNETSGSVKLR